MFDSSLQRRWPIAALIAVTLSSCGGGGETPSTQATPAQSAVTRPVNQSDLQIAALVYSGPRTPDGFYTEANLTGHELLAKSHIKNTDLDASASSAAEFELCTNDWNEALSWSETAAQRATEYAQLVATNDDARYFEFGRVRTGTPQVYSQSRVYKCDYLDRTTANLKSTSGAAGLLNARPLDANEMQRLSEYLWQFTDFNNFGHAVLKSANTASHEHSVFIASLTRAATGSNCDRIDVIAWRHRADATTGAITLTAQTLWSFGAREASGVAQLCAI